jgi:hypothetical protein
MRPTKAFPFLALAVAACQSADLPLAPRSLTSSSGASALGADDSYIVTFSDSVSDVPGLARALAVAYGGSPRYTYQHALKGFSALLSPAAAAALALHRTARGTGRDRPDDQRPIRRHLGT